MPPRSVDRSSEISYFSSPTQKDFDMSCQLRKPFPFRPRPLSVWYWQPSRHLSKPSTQRLLVFITTLRVQAGPCPSPMEQARCKIPPGILVAVFWPAVHQAVSELRHHAPLPSRATQPTRTR